MSALPVTVNLDVYRGDSWAQSFAFKFGGAPVDLSGCVVDAWMRSPSEKVYPLDVAVDDAAAGAITVRFPVGADLPPPNAYVYDIEVTDPNDNVLTYVRGRLLVARDVTNEEPTS